MADEKVSTSGLPTPTENPGDNDLISSVDISLGKLFKYTHKQILYKPITILVAPTSLGIRADYYTDGDQDQVEINLALQAAKALGGGTVELVDATYTTTGRILVPSNCRLKGRSMWKTIIKGKNGSNVDYLVINENSTTSDVNITIEDLQIDANGTNQTAGFAANNLDLRLVTHFVVRNVWFKNGGYDDNTIGAGLGTDQSSQGLIIGCKSSGNTHYGYSFYRSFNLIVANCIAANNGRHGFGVGADNDSQRTHDILFDGCTSIANTQGFWIRLINGITINNCEVDGEGIGDLNATVTTFGMIFSAVNYLTISNCVIHDYQGSNDGIRIDGPFLSQGQVSRYLNIIGNQIYNIAKNGIFLRATGTQGAIVKGNIIRNCTNGYGIIINTNDTIIQGNYIDACGLSGIIVSQCNSCNISNNICKNNAKLGSSTDKYGIFVWSGNASTPSNDNILVGNRCYDDQTVKTQHTGIFENTSNCDRNIYTSNNLRGNNVAGLSTTGANDVVANNITS